MQGIRGPLEKSWGAQSNRRFRYCQVILFLPIYEASLAYQLVKSYLISSRGFWENWLYLTSVSIIRDKWYFSILQVRCFKFFCETVFAWKSPLIVLACTAIAKIRDSNWFKNRCSFALQVPRKNRTQEWASIALMFFSPYETLDNVLLHIYRALSTL